MNRHIPRRRAHLFCQHALSLVAGMTLIFVAFYLGAAMTGSGYHATDAAPVIHKSGKAGRMIDV